MCRVEVQLNYRRFAVSEELPVKGTLYFLHFIQFNQENAGYQKKHL